MEKNDSHKLLFEDLINIKLIIFQILKFWKVYVAVLLIFLWIAYEYNKRQENIYELDALISVKDEQNPFFTTNMSLVFNWGGPSDKVNTIMTVFKSRRHNEKVVKQLKFYIRYYEKGKYYDIDLYGKIPFEVDLNPGAFQAVGIPFQVRFLSDDTFELSYRLDEKTEKIKLYNYETETSRIISAADIPASFSKTYQTGEKIETPLFQGTVKRLKDRPLQTEKNYYFKFSDFHATVNAYRNVFVDNYKNNTSMIVLKRKGKNPLKIQDYLNTSIRILQEKLLRDKNSFATNTIRFIDSTLVYLKADLKQSGLKLQEFQKNRKEFALDNPSASLYSQLLELDKEKSLLETQRLYYESLLDYLRTNQLTRIPSPSIAGIDDPMVIQNTKKLTELSLQREELKKMLNTGSIAMEELDTQIENIKEVLTGNIRSAMNNLQRQMMFVQQKINVLESKLNQLPAEIKQFIDLKREFKIKDEIYSYLLQKRNEVNIVKASNQSNLKVLDEAKYTGQGPIAPKKSVNYLAALMLAIFLPTLLLVIKILNDDTIKDETEVKKITSINILGIIFHYDSNNMMPVLKESVGSRLREAFSILRTNIRLMLPPLKKDGKTILVTSTVSGEGKTFISSNLAAINAMSKQKTILLEFDIRKPKSHKYFGLDKNKIGLIDFIENKSLQADQVIFPTGIENLDIILAGKNATSIKKEIAGILEDKRIAELMETLKQKYDYIFIDTPPIGLVPDTLILNQYADLMLYVVKEGYSKRSYLHVLNEYLNKKLIDKVGIVYNNYKIDIIKKYVYHSKYTYAYAKDGYNIYTVKRGNVFTKLIYKIKNLITKWRKKI